METDDNPLGSIITKLQGFGDRTFTGAALLPENAKATRQRVCAELQAFGLIAPAGRGRWRVNPEKLVEALDYQHLTMVAGRPLTDEVFDDMVADGRLVDTGLTQDGQPLFALTVGPKG